MRLGVSELPKGVQRATIDYIPSQRHHALDSHQERLNSIN